MDTWRLIEGTGRPGNRVFAGTGRPGNRVFDAVRTHTIEFSADI
jgi:hypothetical protein